MLVATFGPSTAWRGREIIWDADHFILVGHGAIPAAGVLDYDRRGQLVWADPALRSWTYQVDLWENGGRSSLTPAAWGVPAAQMAGPAAASRQPRGRVPGWVIVVIVVAVLALLAALTVAAVLPSLVSRTTEALANDLVVRTNVYSLQTGIEAYAADHGGQFPDPGDVNPLGMSRYLSVWPSNPYTELPMADGGGEGNFRYDLSSDGGAYRIIGYGQGGDVVIELSGGDQQTV
jgi:hypothetical protein